MNTIAVKQQNQRNKLFLIFSLIAALAIFALPEITWAASEADQTIKDGVAFSVKIIKLIVYGLMGLTFVVMMGMLLKSLWDWKDDNNRNGTAAGILITLFVGLMVMGVIFMLGEKAITYVDTNVKVTEAAPVVLPYQHLDQLV